MTPEHMVRLAALAVEAWNARDLDGLNELLEPDVVLYDSAAGELRGREAIRASTSTLLTAFPDLRIEAGPRNAVAGDALWQEWRATGTHGGAMGPIAPTQRRIEVRGCNVIEFGATGMRSVTRYWSVLGALGQLGLD